MAKKGVNMSKVKRYNRTLILEALEAGECSRKELAKNVNLTPASISILVNELMDEGWVIETGETEQTKRAGRKQMYLSINPTHKYIIGVNIELDRISFCLTDLHKNLLNCYVQDTRLLQVESLIDVIHKGYAFLLNTGGLEENQILGIGIGIIGEVDAKKGISINAYGLWNNPIDIKAHLSKTIHVPIVVENNVRSLALAEAKKHPNTNTLTFVKYGPGIGSALVHQNGIYRGDFNKALEFGHTIVDPKGLACKCGQNGCLETVASVGSIISILHKKNIIEKTDTNPMNTLVTLYKNNNKEVIKVIDEAIAYFSIAIVNLMKILDTKYIVLYGAFFKKKLFLNLLKDQLLYNHTIKHFKLILSDLPDNTAIGAVYVAYKKLFIDVGGYLPTREGEQNEQTRI